MLLRKHIGNTVITFSIWQRGITMGLNSNLPDGNHILMWETDIANGDPFIRNLAWFQQEAKIPDIYVWRSNPKYGWHAISMRRSTWREAICAASAIPETDMQWLTGSVKRGKMTLRLTEKRGNTPTPYTILESPYQSDVKANELVNGEKYEYLVS